MSETPLPKITPEADIEQPRKIGCITYMWVVALVLCVLVWYNGLRSVPLRISPETTYITEPLTPDGRVDYVAAFKQKLYPPEIATDDNGYRMVFQRLQGASHSPTLSPELVQKYCEELGLDPNLKPDLTYRDLYEFIDYVHRTEPELVEDIVKLIWEEAEKKTHPFRDMIPYNIDQIIDRGEIDQFPLYLLRWLEENNPALDLMAEAVAKPVYFMPMVSDSKEEGVYQLLANSSSHWQGAMTFARGFQPRARYRVAVGDIDGAIDDILACHRLARHLENPGSKITALIGVAIDGVAVAMAIDSNPSAPASEEQLQRLATEMRNLPPHATMEQFLEMQRLTMLDSIQTLSVKGAGEHGVLPTGLRSPPTLFDTVRDFVVKHAGYDWNIIAQGLNKNYDDLIAGTTTSTASGSLEGQPWYWLTLGSRSRDVVNTFSSFNAETWRVEELFREEYHRNDCSHNMKQIVLAMLIYERQHGTLPPAWTVDADGTLLHSWRVLLLPYLGDVSLAELYAQIRLDEPWDSEYNKQFHTQNLDIYRCPSAVKHDGEASYAVIVGDELLFGEDGQGRPLANTKRHKIMLAERKESVCWIQPDVEITQHIAETDQINKGAASSISSYHTGGANFAMRDGGVNFMSETINTDAFIEQVRGSDKALW